MSEHLDLDALADHLAGEGDGAAHLAACAVCQDRLAELAAAQVTVSASLAALPPPPLPPDLEKRIAAALAAETAPTPSALAAPSATVTPLAGRRPAARRTWPLSVAAAVVLVCGAGLGYTLLAGGGNDSAEQTVAAAPDSAAVPDPNAALKRSTSGTDYADPAAVPGGLASVLAGTAPQEALGAAADSRRALPAAPLSSGAGSAEAGDPLDRLRDPAGLASCLLALLPPEEPDVRPLALDYARYGATPALAVVLPDPDPTKVSVFVVGPDCSQDNDSTLLFTRLTKP